MSDNKENSIELVPKGLIPEGLTILQQRFAERLFTMKDPNHRQAYIDAGGKARGASADVQASKMVRNSKVKAYLSALREKAAEQAVSDGTTVINELSKLAYTNIKDYIDIDDDGNVIFRPFDTIDNDKLAAIESIKVRENKTISKGEVTYITTTTEFKLYNKDSALDKLGKHFGIYSEDNRQRQPQTANITFIDGTRTASEVALELHRKQVELGNALYPQLDGKPSQTKTQTIQASETPNPDNPETDIYGEDENAFDY